MDDLSSRDRIERSVRRAVYRRVFLIHAALFVVVMTALFAINYQNRQYGAEWWVVWPLIAWGAALAIHAFFTFALSNDNSDTY